MNVLVALWLLGVSRSPALGMPMWRQLPDAS